MTAQSTIVKAWYDARNKRQIKQGFIFHSDRGVQYASIKPSGQKHHKLSTFSRYLLSKAALNLLLFTPCLAVFSFLRRFNATLFTIEKF